MTVAQASLSDANTSQPVFQAYTPGDYTIALIVDDGFATSTADFVTISVRDNQPPVAVATADVLSGPAPLNVHFDGSASYDPEGKPLAWYFWTFGDGTSGTTEVSPTHTFQSPGSYLVILSVTDERNSGSRKVLVITATSADTQPPQAAITSLPGTLPLGTGFTLLATADDSATGNSTITSADYSLDGGVNWTAMTASDGAFDTAVEPVAAAVPALPVGVYSVQVRATDAAGNIGFSEGALVVMYDSSAGYVTGHGWIESPPGASLADPPLSGKASFGFVSKYQKGATVPTGNTQFQFKAGDLHFKSTEYQWLVVAGGRAQFKGSGTINGEGGYSFMLTAIDGQVNGGGGADRFRIKLSDTATGIIVYDNQTGTDDTAALSSDGTLLQGGSIVVQKK
jgi:PKD repeat protein